MAKLPDDFSLPPVALELGEAERAYQAAVADLDRETARALGIHETDLRCLEILLHDLPHAGPGVLARQMGLTSGAVTAMLDRMEQRRLITRSPDPSDRRKTIVRTTRSSQARRGAARAAS